MIAPPVIQQVDRGSVVTIRSALNPSQLERLRASALKYSRSHSVFALDGGDIVRGVTRVINMKLGEAVQTLTYFDVVAVRQRATRILSTRHRSAALIALDAPLQLSGNISIQPGDIAVYGTILADVAAFASTSTNVLRYYHSSDQPFNVPREVLGTIAQRMGPNEILNLCSSLETFDARLCRSEATLQQLWKMNVSERIPLVTAKIAAIKDDTARVSAMLERYVKVLNREIVRSSYDTRPVRTFSRKGFEKALKRVFAKTDPQRLEIVRNFALEGAALGGQLELFKDLVSEITGDPTQAIPPDILYGIISSAISGGNVELLKYLESITHVTYDAMRLMSAAKSGNMDMYRYVEAKMGLDKLRNEPPAYVNGVADVDMLVSRAFEGGNIDLYKYIADAIRSPLSVESLLSGLSSAAKAANLPMIQYLESFGQFDQASYGRSINAAIDSGHINILKYIASKAGVLSTWLKNSNTAFEDWGSYNPVLYAIGKGRVDMVKLLLSMSGLTLSGAIKNAYAKAFDVAVHSGSVDMLKFIIESGLDFGKLGQKSALSLLSMASWNGNLDMVKYLVSIGDYTRDDFDKINRSIRGEPHIRDYLNSIGAMPKGTRNRRK